MSPSDRSSRWRPGAGIALLWLLALPAAHALDGNSTPPWATELARELMSPFCPGVTVAECPSPGAKSLSAWIVLQADEGRGREEVLEDLYARYGDEIRGAPRAEGFGAAAYWIPVLVFLAGGGGLALFLRRATRARPGGEVPAAAPLDPERERQLDEALSK